MKSVRERRPSPMSGARHDARKRGRRACRHRCIADGALEACFLMVMRGIAENDGYNALVLKAGLQWRDIVLIRSVSRFLRQVRVPFSQDYMWNTLRAHPAIASQIVALFHARFDPRR